MLLLAILVVLPAIVLSLLAVSSLREAEAVYERQMHEACERTAESLIARALDAVEARGVAIGTAAAAFASEMTSTNRLALADGDLSVAGLAILDSSWQPVYPGGPALLMARDRVWTQAGRKLSNAAFAEAAGEPAAAIPLYEAIIERLAGEDPLDDGALHNMLLCRALSGLARALAGAGRVDDALAVLERLAGERQSGGDVHLPLVARYRMWKLRPSEKTALALLDACFDAALDAPASQLYFYLAETLPLSSGTDGALVGAVLDAMAGDRAFAPAAARLLYAGADGSRWAWRSQALGEEYYLYGTLTVQTDAGEALAVVLVDPGLLSSVAVEPVFAAAGRSGSISFEFRSGEDSETGADATTGETIMERTFAEPFSMWSVRAVVFDGALGDLARNRARLMSLAAALTGLVTILGAASVFLWARRRVALARLQTDFVANVTHELKTPLTGIKSLAETLELKRVSSDEKRAEFISMIVRESDRLSRLITSVLDFARLERGSGALRLEPADLAEVVNAAVDCFKSGLLPGEAADVECIAEAHVGVSIDRDAIIGAILNLLDNAYKYSKPPRDIRVCLAVKDEWAIVSVSDNGVGLTPGEARRVFGKFYRADTSLAAETQGAGLGLTLAKAYVEQHGGALSVDSEPGVGSTFTIRLPLAGEAGQ